MKTEIKLSQFVSLLNKGFKYYLYNSVNGGLIHIEKTIAERFQKREDGLFYMYKEKDDFVNYLQKKSYTTENNQDKDKITILKYGRLKSAFQSKRLSLVIAPTLYCNFKCPYCYERDLPQNIMTEKIQNQLVDFIIQRQDSFKELEICWHGGEPTMALSAIEKILDLVHDKVKIPLVQHSMVTNGFAIDDRFISIFKKYPIQLSTGITNLSLYSKYILGTDKFADEKCIKCSLLPVCNGGCSRYRFGDDYQTSDLCPFNEAGIINFLI